MTTAFFVLCLLISLASWRRLSSMAKLVGISHLHFCLLQYYTSICVMSSVKAVVSNWRMNGERSWVADVNGTVVGLITLRGNEVGVIFVEPEFRGNGVGRALMDKAKKLHGNL